jgi:hypothetical protein
MIYNSHNHNTWNKAVDHTDTNTSRGVFCSAFPEEYCGTNDLSRCTSTTLVWVSPISRAMSCDLVHYFLSTAAIMASVLVVVPAFRGRPAFTPAVSVTCPVCTETLCSLRKSLASEWGRGVQRNWNDRTCCNIRCVCIPRSFNQNWPLPCTWCLV